MAAVYYSKVIDAPADKVWAIIRDFGALDVWFPFVSKCVLRDGAKQGQVGAVRANTVADGKIIEEQLLELSDRDRRIVYSVIGGDVPTLDYSAKLAVHDVTDGDRSFVAWSATFDVKGEIEPIVEWVRSGIFKTCLNELEGILRDQKQSKEQPQSA